MGMDVFVYVVKFAVAHVAHQANVDGPFDPKSLHNSPVMIFYAEMLTVSEPVENLYSIFFVVDSRPASHFRQRRNMLKTREGISGWHHDPHAIFSDQMGESVHIVCQRSYLDIFPNKRFIGLGGCYLHGCATFCINSLGDCAVPTARWW